GLSAISRKVATLFRHHKRGALTMSWYVGFIPLVIAAGVWWTLARLNRVVRWFRLGELIFWDAIILVIIYLVWLRWF
ncbi:MAG: hypothetical protein ACYTEO_19080, partial [Planctomycetota bacterium]